MERMSGRNSRKMDLMRFMSAMEGLISSDSLTAVFAMADEECARKIILHFKVSGCEPLSEAGLFITYVPYADIVELLRLEVRINPDKVLAREFMSNQYNKLVKLGAQVAIGKDGVHVIFKVREGRSLVGFIRRTLDLVCEAFSDEKGGKEPNLTYDGFTLVREWVNYT